MKSSGTGHKEISYFLQFSTGKNNCLRSIWYFFSIFGVIPSTSLANSLPLANTKHGWRNSGMVGMGGV